MAPLLSSSVLPSASLRFPSFHRRNRNAFRNPNPRSPNSRRDLSVFVVFSFELHHRRHGRRLGCTGSSICEQETPTLDGRFLSVEEYSMEEELLAAVRLRIRTFNEFRLSNGIEDHKKFLVERAYEALKDRISGMMMGFKRVTCINATIPLSPSLVSADELCSACKFCQEGEDRVVIGTLELNQCLWLADELPGKRPEVVGADVTRAYLSNVCVAKELQRNGLGYALVAKAKKVACEWGITDLYVHVAVDNGAAQKLYERSGFIYESEEPAWKARFLNRPSRFLLWIDLTQTNL